MNENKIKEITNLILSLEGKYCLYNLKFKGKYPIWPFYRMYFYFGYLRFLNIGEKNQKFSNRKIFMNIFLFIVLFFNSKLPSAFLRKKKKFLIVSSQRYIANEEIYTKDLKQVIKDDYIEFSLSEKFRFHKGPIYLDFFKVMFKLISLAVNKLHKSPDSLVGFISEINAPKGFIAEYKRYSIEYALWFFLFDIILRIQKPKKVFFVSGTYFTPLIAASQKNNIETYEIQHGVINQYHLAYHFPKIKGEGFYSTGILLFSNYWKTKADYPIGTKLITTGNSCYANRKTVDKINKSIVFISQPIIAKQLINFLFDNIHFFVDNNFQVQYKLHPSEFNDWSISYKKLITLRKAGLIKVLTNQQPLSKLLAETEIIFGVSSTVMYEGIDSDCKVFIVDLPSSEYFEDLINKGVVKRINKKSKITLEDLQFTPRTVEKFFSQADFEILKKITL